MLPDMPPREFLLWLLRLRRRFRVVGASMAPMLQAGDEVLVDPRAYRRSRPHPGDIVVAQHPYRSDCHIVKRVAAVLEDGRCVLEGDNSLESTDSHAFGPLAPELILGRVTCRFA